MADSGGVETAGETAFDTAIFDVDGTLVDSNNQHALAWYRAFRRFDITLPLWQRLIGEIRPFAATAPLLKAVKQRGFRDVRCGPYSDEPVCDDRPRARPCARPILVSCSKSRSLPSVSWQG